MDDSRSAGINPEAVKNQIVEVLVRRARADAGQIKIDVEDGDVILLRGHVPTSRKRHQAEEAVWGMPGVDTVVNELEVVGEESDYVEL